MRSIADLLLQENNCLNTRIGDFISCQRIIQFLSAHDDLKDKLEPYLSAVQKIGLAFHAAPAILEKEARIALCEQLFELAYADEKAAKLFLTERNGINNLLAWAVSDQRLALFVLRYPKLEDALRQIMPPHRSRSEEAAQVYAKELKENALDYNGVPYHLVSRETRNFNTHLVSIGASGREKIILNPEDSLLKQSYQFLMYIYSKDKKKTTDVVGILTTVSEVIQIIFKNEGHPELKPNDFVPLSQVALMRKGVCRHRSLMAAYLLTRLAEDKILEGNIIHHRWSYYKPRIAHTWLLFQDKNGVFYSVDTYRAIDTHIYQITKQRVLETYGFLTWVGIEELYLNSFIQLVKQYIEIKAFSSAPGFFKKSEIIYPNKEVPTRIAKLYNLCRTLPNEKKLQTLASSWLSKSPDDGEKPFYEAVSELSRERLEYLIEEAKIAKDEQELVQVIQDYVSTLG